MSGMDNDTISRLAAINSPVKMVAEGLDWIPVFHLEQLPSAERRGRWIDIEHAPNGLLYATCSVCGKRQTIEATNYCGNCGADMREKKNGCDDCFIPMFYNLEDDDSICRDCEVGE